MNNILLSGLLLQGNLEKDQDEVPNDEVSDTTGAEQNYESQLQNFVMKNIDSRTHTRGESIYLDDIPLLQGTLFGAAFGSTVAHGHITNLDLSVAEQMPDVVKIFTHKNITGENQIGGIVPDEPLFAEKEVD